MTIKLIYIKNIIRNAPSLIRLILASHWVRLSENGKMYDVTCDIPKSNDHFLNKFTFHEKALFRKKMSKWYVKYIGCPSKITMQTGDSWGDYMEGTHHARLFKKENIYYVVCPHLAAYACAFTPGMAIDTIACISPAFLKVTMGAKPVKWSILMFVTWSISV